MRRLVGISGKAQKTVIGAMALTISLTSIHLAAAARTASLRRQQDKLEQLASGAQPSPGVGLSPSPTPVADQAQHAPAGRQTSQPASAQNEKSNAAGTGSAPARKRQIVISIADRKLALMDGGQVLKTYPIAVGTPGTPSPEGDFMIINHAKDPVYRHGDKEIAPGKDNPLGSRWMGLSLKGYGIHGTNVQSSVGKAASHGCFRMRKQDVEELYTLVRVGDMVTVRRERDALTAQVFAAPSAPAATLAVKAQGNAEVQVASAAVTAVETSQE
jgi:lipoprotein-anchoring transpeptidase ErfK/SrfK